VSQLQNFNHQMFGDFPVIIVEGVEWFGATEVARALLFTGPYAAVRNHIEEEDSENQIKNESGEEDCYKQQKSTLKSMKRQ